MSLCLVVLSLFKVIIDELGGGLIAINTKLNLGCYFLALLLLNLEKMY
jgi:hypothetical protein